MGRYNDRGILAECQECGAVRVAIRTQDDKLDVPGGEGCPNCDGEMHALNSDFTTDDEKSS